MYLVEVFTRGSHLLPGFVEQLDADAEEFLKGAIVGEEHWVKFGAVFTGCGNIGERKVVTFSTVKQFSLKDTGE